VFFYWLRYLLGGGDVHDPGGAVQVDPINPTLKAPGCIGLKLKHDKLLRFASILLSISNCAATPCVARARPQADPHVPRRGGGNPGPNGRREARSFGRRGGIFLGCEPRFGLGLTLVHFSAQLERFVWNTGCA
jgi:hypothetical protein